MADPNLELLLGIARAMGPLCEQVVFVGGYATGLLVDDAGLMDVRPTEDVDAIVEVATLGAYHRLAEQLMQRGFTQTMAGNTPPFRWFWHRMQLDLVPLDEKVLGFANPWYRVGFDEALTATLGGERADGLGDGLVVRHLSAPHFLATKLEAFKDRGGNDVYLSHDLEDIMTVLEGRAAVAREVAAASAPRAPACGAGCRSAAADARLSQRPARPVERPRARTHRESPAGTDCEIEGLMNTTTRSLAQKL